jgi:hypothetical protein
MNITYILGWLGLVLLWIFLSVPKAIVYSIKKTAQLVWYILYNWVFFPRYFFQKK